MRARGRRHTGKGANGGQVVRGSLAENKGVRLAIGGRELDWVARAGNNAGWPAVNGEGRGGSNEGSAREESLEEAHVGCGVVNGLRFGIKRRIWSEEQREGATAVERV